MKHIKGGASAHHPHLFKVLLLFITFYLGTLPRAQATEGSISIPAGGSINFGTLAIGSVSPVSQVVYLRTGVDIFPTAMGPVLLSDTENFSVIEDNCSGFELNAAYLSCDVVIVAHPLSPGPHFATLNIVADENGTGGDNNIVFLQVNSPADEAPVSGDVEFTSSEYSFNEGSDVEICLIRSGDLSASVDVRFKGIEETAFFGLDFTGIGTSEAIATIPANSALYCLPLSLLDNSNEDPERFFSVIITQVESGQIGPVNSTRVNILDNDSLGLAEFGQSTFSFGEFIGSENLGTAPLYLMRRGGSSGELRVKFTTVSGTATSPVSGNQDYGDIQDLEVVWLDGEYGPKFVFVPIGNDTLVEGDEFFYGVISEVDGTPPAVGTINTATINIIDNDTPANPGLLEFSEPIYRFNESGGSATLYVNRRGGFDGFVCARYFTTDGTAQSFTDYTSSQGDVVFMDGEVFPQAIVIPLTNNSAAEPEESFSVLLSESANAGCQLGGATLGNTAVVNIVDDDKPGRVQFTQAAASVGESAGSITVSVERIGGKSGPISMGFITTNGTAIAADYTLTQDPPALLWMDQELGPKTITIPITNDSELEGAEDFFISLRSTATQDIELGSPSTMKITIVDDDDAGTLQFAKPVYSVGEGAGSAEVTVTRQGGDKGTVTVECLASDGSALSPQDYTATQQTLTFLSGDTTPQICSIPITDDSLVEGGESFSLYLANASGGAKIGTSASAQVSIIDNEMPGTLQFSSPTYSFADNIGIAAVTVTRTGGSKGLVQASYSTAEGTAKSVEHYLSTTGILSWTDGDAAEKVIAIPVKDTRLASPVNFSVLLSSPQGGATLATPAAAEVKLIDESEFSAPVEVNGGSGGCALSPQAAPSGSALILWTVGSLTLATLARSMKLRRVLLGALLSFTVAGCGDDQTNLASVETREALIELNHKSKDYLGLFADVGNCEELANLIKSIQDDPLLQCDSGLIQAAVVLDSCSDDPAYEAKWTSTLSAQNCITTASGKKIDGSFVITVLQKAQALSIDIDSPGLAINEVDYPLAIHLEIDAGNTQVCSGSIEADGESCLLEGECDTCLFSS